MPDFMDHVQELALREQEQQAANCRAASRIGLDACFECGETIAPMRKQMGANRCVECQAEAERKAAIARGVRR